MKDKNFCECFPELVDKITADLAKKKKEAEEARDKLQKQVADQNVSSQIDSSGNTLQQSQTQSWTFSILSNMFVMVGLAAFAFVVKYVFNTIN